MKFGKINKKEIIDAAIGALVVENAPTVLSMVVPATYSTGLTGVALSGALAYMVGMFLKKPTIGNVGIAVAVAKIVNEQVLAPVLSSVTPSTATTVQNNARRLRAYASSPRASQNYAYAYNN